MAPKLPNKRQQLQMSRDLSGGTRPAIQNQNSNTNVNNSNNNNNDNNNDIIMIMIISAV